jgi:hypothetical protein
VTALNSFLHFISVHRFIYIRMQIIYHRRLMYNSSRGLSKLSGLPYSRTAGKSAMANVHLHNFQRAKRCSFPSARQRRVINFIFNIFTVACIAKNCTAHGGRQTNGNYFTTLRAVRQGDFAISCTCTSFEAYRKSKER